MPIYLFQSVTDDSKTIEKFFNVNEMPELGDLIQEQGKSWRRILSLPQISESVKNVVHKYPYVSSSLPKNIGDCEKTSGGKPIIRSQAHERDICSKYGFVRE